MTTKEKMFLYGLTDGDMTADVKSLTKDVLIARFEIELDAKPFQVCYVTGKNGHFDGENFRYRPNGVSDEDEVELIRKSLTAKKNLFVENWTNVAHYRNDVWY